MRYHGRMEAFRRIYRLLTEEERGKIRGVLALAIAAALLETAAVLSVLPFMVVVADPIGFLDHPVALWADETFGIWRARDLLLIGGSGVLLLVVGANALGALSLRRLQLTVWNVNHFLSLRLLQSYLSRPYTWYLTLNTSRLNRNILDEVRQVVQGVLSPLLYTTVRGVSAVFLVILLIVVDPGMTLVAGAVLGVAYAGIYLAVRALQERLGTIRSEAAAVRFQVATEAMGGFKEVKSLGAEQEFVRRFEETGPPFVRSTAWSTVISELPRHILEVLAVGTVLAILLFLLTTGRELEEALPVLALFAFAGYKLVPAFHQVFTGATMARFYLSSLRELEEDLAVATLPPPTFSQVDPLHMEGEMRLEGVTFRYDEAPRPALDGVSFTIRKGERVGIVGPTGSGKTTLVDVLIGFLVPDSGVVKVDGEPISHEGWARWRAAVGYVPQSIFLLDDSIAGNVSFGTPASAATDEKVREALRMAALDPLVNELPEGVGTMVGERGVRLSGGQRQRIGIARALFRNPSLLLLDEATSALDSRTEREVMDAVFGLGRECTVVIVAHRLSTLARCDRILVMDWGSVVAEGGWGELLETSELFRVLARHAGEPDEAPAPVRS